MGYTWHLAYSTSRHGFSLKSLYRKLRGIDSPVLLVIKDSNDQVISLSLEDLVIFCISWHVWGTEKRDLVSESVSTVDLRFSWLCVWQFIDKCLWASAGPDVWCVLFGFPPGVFSQSFFVGLHNVLFVCCRCLAASSLIPWDRVTNSMALGRLSFTCYTLGLKCVNSSSRQLSWLFDLFLCECEEIIEAKLAN